MSLDHEECDLSEEFYIRQVSLARYRSRAARYDYTCDRTWPIREQAVANLALRNGDRVLDVGCGTGLSFGLLRGGIGAAGQVYGCEHSPDMAILARQRIQENSWSNVALIEGPAQALELPEAVDAMLFNYTHDICRSERALIQLLSAAQPGARVSIAGVKFFPSWLAPLNVYVWFKNRAYNGKPGELHEPWDIIARWIPDLKIESTQFGMGYLAHGRIARPPVNR